MATVTITIGRDVHERIKNLRKRPDESFSEVLRRELPRTKGVSGPELIAHLNAMNAAGIRLSEESLKVIEDAMDDVSIAEPAWT